MKNFRLALAAFALLMLGAPAFAVDYVRTNTDGSQLFTCEVEGSAFKVIVKYRGEGLYTVLHRGRGTTGFQGNTLASSHEEAAKIACGE